MALQTGNSQLMSDSHVINEIEMIGSTSITRQLIDESWQITINGNGFAAETGSIFNPGSIQLSNLPIDEILILNAPGTKIIGEVISTPNLVIQDSPGSIIEGNLFENIDLDISSGDTVIHVENSDDTRISDNTFTTMQFTSLVGSSTIISVLGSNNMTISNNLFSDITTKSLTNANLELISIKDGELQTISYNIFDTINLIAETELISKGIAVRDVLDVKIQGNELVHIDLTSQDLVQFVGIFVENNTTFLNPKSSGSLIELNIIGKISLTTYYQVDFTGIEISMAREAYSLQVYNNEIADVTCSNQVIVDGTFLIHMTGISLHHIFFKTKTELSSNEIGVSGSLVSTQPKETHMVAYRLYNAPSTHLEFQNSINGFAGYLIADVVVDASNNSVISYPDNIQPLIFWWNSELVDFDAYWLILDGQLLVDNVKFDNNLPYVIDLTKTEAGNHYAVFEALDTALDVRITYDLSINVNDATPPEIIDQGDKIIVVGDPNAEYIWEIYEAQIPWYELYINGVLNKSQVEIGGTPFVLNLPLSDLQVGEYVLELIVSDISGNVAQSTVKVTVIDNDTIVPNIIGGNYFEFIVGTDHILSWQVEDLNISSYEIYLDKSLLMSEEKIYLNLIELSFNTQELELGPHNLTIVVVDSQENIATLEVTILIVSPRLLIEGTGDMVVEVGDQVNITWTILADIPDQFRLLINGSLYDNGTYENDVPISYEIVSSIANIKLNYTLIANSSTGLVNSSTIWVEFIDSFTPLIKGSNDISFLVGQTGNYIRWFVIDENHILNYTLMVNGETLQNSTQLDTFELKIGLDHLSEGQYNYTLFVVDGSGNIANDTVIVVVFPNYDYTIPINSDEPAPLFNISSPVLIGAAAVMIFVGGTWVAVRRR